MEAQVAFCVEQLGEGRCRILRAGSLVPCSCAQALVGVLRLGDLDGDRNGT